MHFKGWSIPPPKPAVVFVASSPWEHPQALAKQTDEGRIVGSKSKHIIKASPCPAKDMIIMCVSPHTNAEQGLACRKPSLVTKPESFPSAFKLQPMK